MQNAEWQKPFCILRSEFCIRLHTLRQDGNIMALDPRFLADHGREVFTGNELLVKGCLEVEGGVHLMTGYPGSPVAGFFDILGDISKLIGEKGIRAFQANNEALVAASANGSP